MTNDNRSKPVGVTVGEKALRLRLVRALLSGVLFSLAAALTFAYIRMSNPVDGAPQALRKGFQFDQSVGESFFNGNHLAPSKPAPARGTEPRFNGGIGLEDEVEIESYRVKVDSGENQLQLKISEIQALPQSSESADFKCIEGWSEVVQYSGVKFSDFMSAFHVGHKPDGSLFPYVGMETPDGKYYVSIDIQSMLSPQTMLAFEMNGMELAEDNGYPIRLIIPNKYGIKNLKRVGRIFFSEMRPRDYWHERGYDWYSGL